MGDNLPAALPAGSAVEVEVGKEHTCARLSAGGLKCWGKGGQGRLGSGDTPGTLSDPSTAVVFDLGASYSATAIQMGNQHSCALLTAGAVKWCVARAPATLLTSGACVRCVRGRCHRARLRHHQRHRAACVRTRRAPALGRAHRRS